MIKNTQSLQQTVVWGVITPLLFGVVICKADPGQTSSPSSSNLQPVIKDGTIGYAMTGRRWAFYLTETGKTECPHGFNLGPREQFERSAGRLRW